MNFRLQILKVFDDDYATYSSNTLSNYSAGQVEETGTHEVLRKVSNQNFFEFADTKNI